MEDNDEYIERAFRCNICQRTHVTKLNKKLIKGRKKFPFPYIFLHDHIEGVEHKEVLSILYIDNNLQIRHSETQELGYDELFSKEQVIAITKPLLEEIDILRKDVENLTAKLNLVKK